MPITQSSNVTATANEQPVYSFLWHPYAIDPGTSGSPTAAIPFGSVLQFNTAGVGANPGPGGDGGATPYTVAMVDIAATSTTSLFAGVFQGSSTLGATNVVPTTFAGLPAQLAMAGVNGLMQVLCDATTTIGHTIIPSTTVAGAAHDSGATTSTAGTTIGVALQAVTISSGTALVWCFIQRV